MKINLHCAALIVLKFFCCTFLFFEDKISRPLFLPGSIETIRIWNVSNGQALHRMGTGRAERNKETIVWCLAVTSDLTIISGDSRYGWLYLIHPLFISDSEEKFTRNA